MIRRLRSFTIAGGLIVLTALLLFNGCSNNAPLEPNLPQSTGLDRLVATGELLSTTEAVLDAAYIEADDGGVILIERESYIHEFIVDAGALDENTEISVKLYRDKIGAADVVVFEFGPEGLVFIKAAHLKFQMAELSERAVSAKLHFFDPAKGKWILQESSRVDNGMAEFPIYHFSKYAISD